MTDEPLADLASVPLYYVNKLARGSVKVVLSGEGSDEIFGGYTFDRWVERGTKRVLAASGFAGTMTRSALAEWPRVFSGICVRRSEAFVETDLRNSTFRCL